MAKNEMGYNKEELSKAHEALLSTLQKCEKINLDNLTASRRTLLKRRIAALKIALELIERKQIKQGK